MTILLGPGAVIGEMALLTLKPRTASVTATTESSVYVLTPTEFASLLDTCPAIARYVRDGAARAPPPDQPAEPVMSGDGRGSKPACSQRPQAQAADGPRRT